MLRLDREQCAKWPFRLLMNTNCLRVHDDLVEISVPALMETHPALLASWVYKSCLAICSHRIHERVDFVRAKTIDLNVVLHTAFTADPWTNALADFARRGPCFMHKMEAVFEQGQLADHATRALDVWLTVPLQERLNKVLPLTPSLAATATGNGIHLKGRGHVRIDSRTLRDVLGPELGVKINVVTGEVAPSPVPLRLSVRGAMLCDEPGLGKTRTTARFLAEAAGSSLVVVGSANLGLWTQELLAECAHRVRVIDKAAVWNAIHPGDFPNNVVVLTTYEFLQSDVYKEFHQVSLSEACARELAQKLETLRRIADGVVQSDLYDEVRARTFLTDYLELRRLVDVVLELKDGTPDSVEQDEEHQDDGNNQQDLHDDDQVPMDAVVRLLTSRLNVMATPWRRVVMDDPRENLYIDYRTQTDKHFSAETWGQVCFNWKHRAASTTRLKRDFAYFVLASTQGFRWLVGADPFCSPTEARACLDLLGVEVDGLPWIVFGEQIATPAVLPRDLADRRDNLFYWASFLVLAETCALRRTRQDELSVTPSFDFIPVTLTHIETTLYRLASPAEKITIAACLPRRDAIRLYLQPSVSPLDRIFASLHDAYARNVHSLVPTKRKRSRPLDREHGPNNDSHNGSHSDQEPAENPDQRSDWNPAKEQDANEEAGCKEHQSNSLCGICHEPVVEHVTTPCGHTFCQACFDHWTSSQYEDGQTTHACASCRALVHQAQVSHRGMLGSSKVRALVRWLQDPQNRQHLPVTVVSAYSSVLKGCQAIFADELPLTFAMLSPARAPAKDVTLADTKTLMSKRPPGLQNMNGLVFLEPPRNLSHIVARFSHLGTSRALHVAVFFAKDTCEAVLDQGEERHDKAVQ